jgi:CO dehydrogenase maturation factor
MKIAIVGKGGSGKSSVSWLLANYFSEQGKRVLAVDADYNMDLTYSLGLDPYTIATTVHSTEDFFNSFIKKSPQTSYKDFALSQPTLPFTFELGDEYTSRLAVNTTTPNIDLILGGIGHEDVLQSNKCGHAHLSPLKYYLAMLETKQDEIVIIDSIAGLDMVNFGLYAGCDIVICVVENHRNSIHVYNQIQKNLSTIGIPLLSVINKQIPTSTTSTQVDLAKFDITSSLQPLGILPVHLDVITGQYSSKLASELGLDQISQGVLDTYSSIHHDIDNWQNLRKFDAIKLGATL